MKLHNKIPKYNSSNRKDNEKRPVSTIHSKRVTLYMTDPFHGPVFEMPF